MSQVYKIQDIGLQTASPNLCEGTGHSRAFSEVQRGTGQDMMPPVANMPAKVHKGSMTTMQLHQFIELYRSLPCLWKVKLSDYKNKLKRQAAYDTLVDFCRSFYPAANVCYVKSKIANLRTVFAKEVAKIDASKRSGAGAGEVYVPRLWYYDLLKFVQDQDDLEPGVEAVTVSQSVLYEDDEVDEKPVIDEFTLPTVLMYSSVPAPDPQPSTSAAAESTCTPAQSNTSRSSSPNQSKRKRKRSEMDDLETLMIKTAELLNRKDDDIDTFTAYVGTKMRLMSPDQRIAFEILATDIMYRGLQNRLNPQFPQSIFTDHGPPPQMQPVVYGHSVKCRDNGYSPTHL
ncbi:uncharacterized protein [Hyperolius riggenbachi]|uniref:uncharacterized protein isoform X2 n=1 Tax=Hyperolius riggenbachi TaxID=752182 RepID=UPI0035A2F7D1